MIEQKQSANIILQDGERIHDTVEMSLDLDSANTLMQILSKNLYSDAIGSTVREVASNALDSHRAAGVTDKPIVVSLTNKNGNYTFTVEDFGVGLDHNDVVDIISKYGKSLKRLSNNQLGMFGLGWKAPLAYVPSFTFIIRKDGVERKYIMSEGEERNIIDLVDENSTAEGNGVKVMVPVKNYDISNFYRKIREQLCYFENVYFDVNYSSGIDNSFKITRYENFQLSEIADDTNLHLCLDNVYYPLDFSKLGISRIDCPIALRFGLSDGIYPTPSREAIRYTTEAKATILKKIKTVASELVEMYNKSVEDTDDFGKIIEYYKNSSRYVDIGHKSNVDITEMVQYSGVKVKKPHLKDISLLNLETLANNVDEIFSEYNVKYRLAYGRMRERKRVEHLYYNSIVGKGEVVYKFSDRISANKREYIKSFCHSATFIKKIKSRKLFPDKKAIGTRTENDVRSYYILLDLKKHPRKEWRDRIKEFQMVQASLEKDVKDADALEIPKAWLDSRRVIRVSIGRKKSGHQRLEGELPCKKAELLEKYIQGRDCKFTPFSIDLGKAGRTGTLYIYNNHEGSEKLDKLYNILSKQKVTLVTFSEREMKKVKEIDVHNIISYEKFMEGNTKVFKRIVTSHLIKRLISDNEYVFNKWESMKNVSTRLGEKLYELKNYGKNNYYSNGDEKVYEAMVTVAEKYSLFDETIYTDYLEVKDVLDKFPFLEILCCNVANEEDRNPIIAGMLKYNKYRVNLSWYAKPQNVKSIEEQQISN